MARSVGFLAKVEQCEWFQAIYSQQNSAEWTADHSAGKWGVGRDHDSTCTPSTFEISLLESFPDSKNNHTSYEWSVAGFFKQKKKRNRSCANWSRFSLVSQNKNLFIKYGNPWKIHQRPLLLLCDFKIKQVHERMVLLTVSPDLGTESSLSGYDIAIRILKACHKNKIENFIACS